MGLLDELLGSLTGSSSGGAAPQPQQRGSSPANTGGADMSRIMMALLPIVLAMLSNRGGHAQGAPNTGGDATSGGGGLADIFGQVLGGSTGGSGGMGGLGGLLEQLQRAGFGEQASSWVARGENKQIPPDAMGQVFGRDVLERIARQAGLSVDDASRGLSQLLPEVVDRVTPQGEAPDFDSLTSSVEQLSRRFARR